MAAVDPSESNGNDKDFSIGFKGCCPGIEKNVIVFRIVDGDIYYQRTLRSTMLTPTGRKLGKSLTNIDIGTRHKIREEFGYC